MQKEFYYKKMKKAEKHAVFLPFLLAKYYQLLHRFHRISFFPQQGNHAILSA